MFKSCLWLTLLFSSFSSIAIDSLFVHQSTLNNETTALKPRFSLAISADQSGYDSGFNISLLDETDMNFVTMKCLSPVDIADNQCTEQNAPWIKNSRTPAMGNRHGIGIFINSEKNILAKFTDYQFKAQSDVVYEYGLGYNYAINNADISGLNFAAHIYQYHDKRLKNLDDVSGITVQVGYQF